MLLRACLSRMTWMTSSRRHLLHILHQELGPARLGACASYMRCSLLAAVDQGCTLKLAGMNDMLIILALCNYNLIRQLQHIRKLPVHLSTSLGCLGLATVSC